MDTRQAVSDFLKDKPVIESKSLVWEPGTLYSWGYHWPLITEYDDDAYALNVTPASPTTNRHRALAYEALLKAGYRPTNATYTLPYAKGPKVVGHRFGIKTRLPDALTFVVWRRTGNRTVAQRWQPQTAEDYFARHDA